MNFFALSQAPPPAVIVPTPPSVKDHAEQEARRALETEAAFATGALNRPPPPSSRPKRTLLKPRPPAHAPPKAIMKDEHSAAENSPEPASPEQQPSEPRSTASASTSKHRVKSKGKSKGSKAGKGGKRDPRR